MATITTKGARAVNVAARSAASKKRAPSGAVTTSASPSSTLVESLADSKPAPKRRKTTTKTATPAAQTTTIDAKSDAPTPYRHAGPNAYTPTLLPPTLSFSLPDAISHLTTHDPRFQSFFDHIPCKPFQPPLEAIDPFKTLVTSIIGQQVSWMAARAINKRFRELFGFENEDGFPSPMQVAGEEVMRLKGVGLSTRKAEYGEFIGSCSCIRVAFVCRSVADFSHLPRAALCRWQTVDRALTGWYG
jgi:DNA-3-methyladenine glycosylase II